MPHQDLAAAFIALPARAKVAVLARTIHMETIHVRGAHLDDPKAVLPLYQSSEYIHRLSGFIMALSHESHADHEWAHAATALIDGVSGHGPDWLAKLGEWIADAETLA